MQWLLHRLTPAAAQALVRHEHKTHDLSELSLADDTPPAEILAAARARQWDVITTDGQLAGAPYETDRTFNRSIVHLQLPGGDVEQDDAVDRLFARYKRLTTGRLYTVTASRVKVRQLPQHRAGKV